MEFGWQMAKKLGEMDIGQAIAVKEKEIHRGRSNRRNSGNDRTSRKYCKSGGWTLFKVSKPQQDMRFDVPCVGPDTIQSLLKIKPNVLL